MDKPPPQAIAHSFKSCDSALFARYPVDSGSVQTRESKPCPCDRKLKGNAQKGVSLMNYATAAAFASDSYEPAALSARWVDFVIDDGFG